MEQLALFYGSKIGDMWELEPLYNYFTKVLLHICMTFVKLFDVDIVV